MSGLLTVDRAYVDLGTCDWIRSATAITGKYRFLTTISGIKHAPSASTTANILCSAYKTISNVNNYNCTDGICVHQSNDDVLIYDEAYSSVETSVDQFKAAMDGVQFVYELAEPQTYQLTPQQIQTLVGENNVWSDAGQVAVRIAEDLEM